MKAKLLLGIAAVLLATGGSVAVMQSRPTQAVSKLTYWDNGTGSTTSLIDVQGNQKTVSGTIEVHSTQNNALPRSEWDLSVGGKQTQLAFGASDAWATAGNISIRLNNRPDYEVGTGTIKREQAHGIYDKDYSVFTFTIDLAKAGITDVKTGVPISLSSSSIGNGAATGTIGGGADQSAATTPSGTQTTSAGSSSTNANSSSSNVNGNGVVTDKGNADTTKGNQNNNNDNIDTKLSADPKQWDADGIKLTKVAGDNVYNSRYMAMTTDGSHAYVYVKMQPNEQMPGYGDYNFNINGKTVHVWSHNLQTNLTSDGAAGSGTMTAGSDYDGSNYGTVGNAVIQQFSGPNGMYQTMEFSVDLSKVGAAKASGQEITVSNPNVGNGSVTAAGGSTGPVLLAGAGVLIAGFGYWKVHKRGLLKRLPAQAAGK